jgi:predicted GIY-YIG superfamily endonuclease
MKHLSVRLDDNHETALETLALERESKSDTVRRVLVGAVKSTVTYLYAVHGPDNSVYVGISTNPTERWVVHKMSAAAIGRPLQVAMHTHGPKAFTLEVLGDYETWEQACAAEVETIGMLKAAGATVYNVETGGGGRPPVLNGGYNKTVRMDQRTRDILVKYADEGENASETIRRLLAEFDDIMSGA